MGRRKIEIKAIKDDRNRSVTFLKRKGGLFKKAHELSVLCSVDVAIIIFGQNKKLYEFSSGDIQQTLHRYNYSGVPHEHKGPADFADKGGGDDDDEDDDAMPSPPPEASPPPHHPVHGHSVHHQPTLHHMRQTNASSSPPVHNALYPHHRVSSTPQPHPSSRPESRTHDRRQSSQLSQQLQATPPQSQYAYSYSNNAQYGQQLPPSNAPLQMQQHQVTPPLHHHNYTHPHPQTQQLQKVYMQDHGRRQSVPMTLASHHHQQDHAAQPPSINNLPQPSRPFQSPPLPEPRQLPVTDRRQHEYSRPDDRAPMITTQWAHAEPQNIEPGPRTEPGPRSQSIDVGAAMRAHGNNGPATARYPPPSMSQSMSSIRHIPPRTNSASGIPNIPPPTPRHNSTQSDAKRPRLTVQIPMGADQSDGGADEEPDSDEGSAEDAEQDATAVSHDTSGSSATPAKTATTESGSHSTPATGIVLPAPSPRSASAGAILSAGPNGPTNPFARPSLPSASFNISNNGNSSNKMIGDNYKYDSNNIASPMSALPSRVMHDNGYMSSPSSMFPELGGFGGLMSAGPGGNNLASPAIYQPTPIAQHGPSWRDEALSQEKKRRSPEEEGQHMVGNSSKRLKIDVKPSV